MASEAILFSLATACQQHKHFTSNFTPLITVPGYFPNLVRLCCAGEKDLVLGNDVSTAPAPTAVRTFRQDATLLIFCFVGLQGSYLTWGLLQEKVMTQVSVTGGVGPILSLSQLPSPSLHAPQYTLKLAMVLTLVQFILLFILIC